MLLCFDKRKAATMRKRRHIYGNLCLFLLGLILISISLLIFAYFDIIYDYLIAQAMSFNEKSKSFEAWKKTNPPIPMDIYLFNWTNPEDIHNPDIKPKFQEVGPYRFKEVKEKVNVTWNDNHTISYRMKRSYYYDPENNKKDLNDVITMINPVPLFIAYKSRDAGYFSKRTISYSLSTFSSFYVKKTVAEMLFDGYEESILSILSNVPMMNVVDRFGWFYGRNGTVSADTMSMWTKTDENFGKILTLNEENRTNYYEGSCGGVRGSAGEFFPINRKRDYLELFSPDLCRTAFLEYERDVVVKGVNGFRYTAKNLFDNGTIKPENSCYCDSECLPSGVLNVTKCRENSPIFLSLPHFYQADPYYTNQIDGLDPSEKHEFYMTLEPKAGIVVDVAAQMQINILLQPINDITMYEKVPNVLMPIFYINQRVILRDELAPSLMIMQNLPNYSNIFILICCTLGLMLLLWFNLNMFCCKPKTAGKYPLNDYKIPQNPSEEIPLRS